MKLSLSESVRFGMGVDTRLQQARGEAFTFDKTTQGSGGQDASSTLSVITQQRELMNSLGVSVSASVRYGLASVDARMQFAEQNALDQSSVCVALHAWALNPAAYTQGRRLTAEAEQIYRRSPEDFRRIFGDSYIDEIYTGGSLTILYIFRTSDASSQRSLEGGLRVSVKSFAAGGDISASFKDVAESHEKRSELSITAFISGGRGLVNPGTLDESIMLYRNFSATVLNAGIPYVVTAKPWGEFPLPVGPTWVETLVRGDTIETAGRNVLQGIQDRSRIQYILRNPHQFIDPDLPSLTAALNDLLRLQTRWGRAAAECNEDSSKCSLEDLAYPAITWPERHETMNPLLNKKFEVAHDERAAPWFHDTGTAETFEDSYFYDQKKRGRYVRSYDKGKVIGGIYWTPETGAHVVYGGIFLRYLELDGPNGRLGYPVTDEEYFDPKIYPDRIGDRCQRFEGGELWWDHKTTKVMDDFALRADGTREHPLARVPAQALRATKVSQPALDRLKSIQLRKR